jgi:hypothetical protein
MKLFVPSIASQNIGMKKLFLITRLFFSVFIQASRKIAYQPQTVQLPGVRISLDQQQNFASVLRILFNWKAV